MPPALVRQPVCAVANAPAAERLACSRPTHALRSPRKTTARGSTLGAVARPMLARAGTAANPTTSTGPHCEASSVPESFERAASTQEERRRGKRPGASQVGLTEAELTALAATAERVADAAREIARRYFRTRVASEVSAKSDESPVTRADREAESAMRAIIREEWPAHDIFGEEHGFERGTGGGAGEGAGGEGIASSEEAAAASQAGPAPPPEFLWVLDPIDGTKSFITGKPLFGSLVAVLHRGVPAIGVVDAPALRERWVGVAGRATRHDRRPSSTRACPRLQDAYLYATSPHMFSGESAVSFSRLASVALLPQYGCDCYAYGLLASGFADIVAEADMKPYDYLALIPVVEGAGGTITDWSGASLSWVPPEGQPWSPQALPRTVLAAGDPALHAEALWTLDWKGN